MGLTYFDKIVIWGKKNFKWAPKLVSQGATFYKIQADGGCDKCFAEASFLKFEKSSFLNAYRFNCKHTCTSLPSDFYNL